MAGKDGKLIIDKNRTFAQSDLPRQIFLPEIWKFCFFSSLKLSKSILDIQFILNFASPLQLPWYFTGFCVVAVVWQEILFKISSCFMSTMCFKIQMDAMVQLVS